MGASHSSWCFRTSTVWGWPEDCCARRTRRWVLHYTRGEQKCCILNYTFILWVCSFKIHPVPVWILLLSGPPFPKTQTDDRVYPRSIHYCELLKVSEGGGGNPGWFHHPHICSQAPSLYFSLANPLIQQKINTYFLINKPDQDVHALMNVLFNWNTIE